MASPWENGTFAEESLAHMDAKFLPQTEQQVDWLLQKMRLHPGDSLLDLGCGAGRHAILFSQRGIRVTGIDISKTMLRHAQKRAESAGVAIRLIREDLSELAKLRLPAHSFQGAICLCESGFGVLGSENNDFTFLKQVHALLAPDAFFALTCFNALRRYIRSGDRNPRFDYINGTVNWDCEVEGGVKLHETQRQYIPSEIMLLMRFCSFQEVEALACIEGQFSDNPTGIEDIEMLLCAKKGRS